jgi:hypothetical protein
MMASIIYSLCALLSLGVAVMLWRHHARTRSRLLYWSALCFSGLTINNILLVVDKLVLPEADLSLLRQATALLSLCVMLFGLTWEEE